MSAVVVVEVKCSKGHPDAVSRPTWQHRDGDTYVVICTSIVGNPEAGYDSVHDVHPKRWARREQAERFGFTLGRSDDFNIGAIRNGKLAAILWMGEVVDDGADVLAGYDL